MMSQFKLFKIARMLMAGAVLSASSPAIQAENVSDRPALWQVSDEDTAIYLFGLPYMMDANTDWRSAAFDEALALADTIMLESDRQSPEAQTKLHEAALQIGVYRDGSSLSENLDDETLTQAQTTLASLGVPLQALDQLKPWLATSQLQSMMMQRRGFVGTATPARVIRAAAEESEKRLTFFEGTTALLLKTAGLPEDSQVRMFKQSLDAIKNNPDGPGRFLSQWARGDVEALAESLHGEGEWADDTVRNVMLLERNSIWETQLEELMETESGVIFVAVGIGHLVGEDSLVNRLLGAGYKMERR